MEANLIVSYDPSHTGGAKEEVEKLLKELKEEYKIVKDDEGILEIKVKDGKKIVKKLTKIAEKEISKFERTFHWIPIDKWCKATVKDMQSAIKKIQEDIKKTEKWAMDLGKRKTDLHERDLIIKLTEPVDKPKVDLKNPEKIIKVEIIGNKAGIALLTPDELLNVPKLKQ